MNPSLSPSLPSYAHDGPPDEADGKMSRNSERLAEQVRQRGAKLALSRRLKVSPSTVTRIANGTLQPGLKLRLAFQKLGFPIRGWDEVSGG